MKKSFILIVVAFAGAVLFFSSEVNGQTTMPSPWRLGIGLDAGVPTGYESTYSSFQLGGTARLQYYMTGAFALTLTAGYYNLIGKTFRDVTPNGAFTAQAGNLSIVPVKVGVKIFFAPALYFGAEAGAGFEAVNGGTANLILSPALGYDNKTWDVAVRYENFSGPNNSFGLLGLRVGYNFGL